MFASSTGNATIVNRADSANSSAVLEAAEHLHPCELSSWELTVARIAYDTMCRRKKQGLKLVPATVKEAFEGAGWSIPDETAFEAVMRERNAVFADHFDLHDVIDAMEAIKGTQIHEPNPELPLAWCAMGGAPDLSGCVPLDNIKSVVELFELRINLDDALPKADGAGLTYQQFSALLG
ncbi:unnamed protein product [Pedinophyceae sp. YPF-701]|nr:unnamed protein product [Pedinophyceae sp. YPF-701]